MKLLLVGTPSLAIPTFTALADAGHEVVGVLTREPARTGRSRQLTPSPVAAWAVEQNFGLIETNQLRSPEIQAEILSTGADLAVVVAYGVLVPGELLSALPYGWINLHFSELPRWRGASPVQRALEAGDEATAVTVFQLEVGLDTGPIWRSQSVAIEPQINAGELLEQLSELGAEVCLDAVTAIADGKETPIPQAETGVTLAPRIGRDQTHVDFNGSAWQAHNFIRSRSPRPGAFAWLGQARVKILASRVVDTDQQSAGVPSLRPGELQATKNALYVGCGQGILELVRVAPVGKPHMGGADWARGARLPAGATLS